MKPNVSGRRRAGFVLVAALAAMTATETAAHARPIDACQLAWSKAVRSYLTKNRKAAPDGTVASDMDGMEQAAQAWLATFRPACEIEAAGDKPSARVEAALIGTKVLAKLDMRGCARFLEYFMESTRPQDLCRAVPTSTDDDLRSQIEGSIPAK